MRRSFGYLERVEWTLALLLILAALALLASKHDILILVAAPVGFYWLVEVME